MTELRGVILSHYTGVVEHNRASRMLAMLGEWGLGRVEHVDIESQSDIVLATSAYETGGVVRVKVIDSQGPKRAWTKKRQYLLDPTFTQGSTLGPAEVRAYGPEVQGCAQFTHIVGGGYRAWSNGTVTCEGRGEKTFLTVWEGQRLSVPVQGSCYSDCWVAGIRGIPEEKRELAMLPVAHPILRTDTTGLEGKPFEQGVRFDETATRIQKIMEQNIAENREALMTLGAQNEEIDGTHWGAWVGGAVLMGTLAAAAAVFLMYRRWRRKNVPPAQAGSGDLEMGPVSGRSERGLGMWGGGGGF